jgi:hypothetical protein
MQDAGFLSRRFAATFNPEPCALYHFIFIFFGVPAIGYPLFIDVLLPSGFPLQSFVCHPERSRGTFFTNKRISSSIPHAAPGFSCVLSCSAAVFF